MVGRYALVRGATHRWVLFMSVRVATTLTNKVRRISKEGAKKKKEGAEGGKREMKEGAGTWGKRDTYNV